MEKFLTTLLAFLILISCNQTNEKEKQEVVEQVEYQQIFTSEYELELPNIKPEAVLILFPGFPQTAIDTKREFQILEKAKANNIAVLYSNLNRKLWLEEDELKTLAEQIKKIFSDSTLPGDNVYVGGFSSGGNIAMLLGDYLTAYGKYSLAPKGVFILDSPIDLAALYATSEKNLERNFSEASV